MEILNGQELAQFTWYKIGGSADRLYFPESVSDLISVQKELNKSGETAVVFSGATNVLISDAGVRGATICTQRLRGLESRIENDRLIITAHAGDSKAQLTKIFLQHKLAPALFLSGIPGNIDGGVFMNAGVSEEITPREFSELVDWIEVVRPDGDVDRVSKSDLHWVYRKSQGWQPGIIARIGMSWPHSPRADIVSQVRAATKSRLKRQPLEFPSCGSVFVNPVGDKSGRLIEAAGLKGMVKGGAQVSQKHANFIVNNGGATAEDVRWLISHVRQTVSEKFGVELKQEVQFIGEWDV